MPPLTCQGLTRTPFLAGMSLALERGSIAILAGPSGSGKSLLLRALADLDPIEAGRVELDGRERSSVPSSEWRRRVTYVHQGGVLRSGTVAEHVRRIAELRAQRDAGGPSAEVLLSSIESAGLDPQRDTGTLSGGEAQTVALLLALHLKPDVLLLDEATSAMDPALATRSEARIRAFAEDGGTVLWISHDQELAERVGGRQLAFAELANAEPRAAAASPHAQS